jgi:hypothetical protein
MRRFPDSLVPGHGPAAASSGVMDRRFNRRRYDAGQTTSIRLESERITASKENR